MLLTILLSMKYVWLQLYVKQKYRKLAVTVELIPKYLMSETSPDILALQNHKTIIAKMCKAFLAEIPNFPWARVGFLN